MRSLMAVVLAMGLVACSDDEGPNAADIAGTWSGTWTITGFPSTVAVLELDQEGTALTGSLGIGSAITATITDGQVDEETFSASLEYEGSCPGTIEMEGDVLDGATRLEGTYTLEDCEGPLDGTFNLTQ